MTLAQFKTPALAVLLVASAIHAQQSTTAVQPYQESFPVSHAVAAKKPAPVAAKKPSEPISDGSLRLLPSVKPTNKAVPRAPQVAPATTEKSPAKTSAAASTPAHAVATAPKPSAKPTPAPATNAISYGPFNRGVVVIDAAHGGVDSGSRITDSLAEKDVTLALAFRLRSLLQVRGFTVVLTRDSDAATVPGTPNTPLTLDSRAGIANHARPVACLLLHVTAAGVGVHLYRSELVPTPFETSAPNWLTAQSPWTTASAALSGKFVDALEQSHIPHVNSMASVRPVDSLECPAIVVELAPRDAGDGSTTNDAAYQGKVAEALAGALVFWRNTAQPPARAAAPAPAHTTSKAADSEVTP